MKTPLGAYYRVNARRLDDMQSALTELNALAASTAIHEGWREPVREMHHGRPIWVIRRPEGREPEPLGGHAFLLAGYNDVGFLVQNSWGPIWGRHGYATLPYADSWNTWWDWYGNSAEGFAAGNAEITAAAAASVVGAGKDHPACHVVSVRQAPDDTKGNATSDPAQTPASPQDGDRSRPGRRPRRAATSDGSCCTPMAGSSARSWASRSPTG